MISKNVTLLFIRTSVIVKEKACVCAQSTAESTVRKGLKLPYSSIQGSSNGVFGISVQRYNFVGDHSDKNEIEQIPVVGENKISGWRFGV